jgi:hypothetical protein
MKKEYFATDELINEQKLKVIGKNFDFLCEQNEMCSQNNGFSTELL